MQPNLFMQSKDLSGSYPLKSDGTLRTGGLIKVESLSHGFETPVSPLRPSFASSSFHSGVLMLNPITITRQTDLSSTELVKACLARKVIPNLQIISGIMVSAGAAQNVTNIVKPHWILRLTDALFTQFSYESSDEGAFVETISMHYSAIGWMIWGTKPDGTLAAAAIVTGRKKDNSALTAFDGDFADSKFTPAGNTAGPADYFDLTKWP